MRGLLAALGLSASLAASCLVTTDLPEAGAGANGSGAAGGAGGATGGQGGGGVTLSHAADWSASMTALYLFEQPPPNLGFDDSGNGHKLTAQGLPVHETNLIHQGEGALSVTDGNILQGISPDFAPTSFTFGGWFKAREAGDGVSNTIMIVQGEADGYGLGRLGNDAIRCIVSAEGNPSSVQTEPEVLGPQQWRHLTCRYDATGGLVDAFVDGAVDVSENGQLGQTLDAPFRIGGAFEGFDGFVDEVFFAGRSLSEGAILRVYACGVDGMGCLCEEDDPSAYHNCGNAEPNCGALPACDSAAP